MYIGTKIVKAMPMTMTEAQKGLVENLSQQPLRKMAT